MQDEINFEEFKSLVLLLFPSLAAGQEKRAEAEREIQLPIPTQHMVHGRQAPVKGADVDEAISWL